MRKHMLVTVCTAQIQFCFSLSFFFQVLLLGIVCLDDSNSDNLNAISLFLLQQFWYSWYAFAILFFFSSCFIFISYPLQHIYMPPHMSPLKQGCLYRNCLYDLKAQNYLHHLKALHN